MSNPFITDDHDELETAILLENAVQCDLSTIDKSYADRVAFTNGTKVFINDDDNLARLLPAYDHKMLKWLLWHEKFHIELRHHNRFFRYLDELRDADLMDEFHVTHEEVNIIMDILVHDSLSKMFPDIVETATANLAQMRNRNSLGYTFKTHTLEEMLDEYKAHKKDEDSEDGDGEPEDSKGGDGTGDTKTKSKKSKPTDDKTDGTSTSSSKGHEDGGDDGSSTKGSDEEESDAEDKSEQESEESGSEPEHDKTDWSKLDKIDTKEFISEGEYERIVSKVEELKRKKFKLSKLTQTLNGMVATEKIRTYARPSYVGVSDGIMLKGRKYAKTSLYLVFDASGSMGSELALFKEIISKTIPQAMECPCEWFAGWGEHIASYKKDDGDGYFKGKFKDIMPVHAHSGYNDDGDRTIELCWQAEQLGYSPIGVTDGGGGIYWTNDKIKQLKRTVLVGQDKAWLDKVKRINPAIQTLDI